MTLTFTNRRIPTSLDELTDAERQQTLIPWEFANRDPLIPAEAIEEFPGECEVWTVERDGLPAFDFWFLPPASGTIYYHGLPVATGIRLFDGGWQTCDGPESGNAQLLLELVKAWSSVERPSASPLAQRADGLYYPDVITVDQVAEWEDERFATLVLQVLAHDDGATGRTADEVIAALEEIFHATAPEPVCERVVSTLLMLMEASMIDAADNGENDSRFTVTDRGHAFLH
jgi:hypothetical protein